MIHFFLFQIITVCVLYSQVFEPSEKCDLYCLVQCIKQEFRGREKTAGIFVEDLVISKIKQNLRQEIVPRFWSYFTDREKESDGFEKFKNAVANLYCDLDKFFSVVSNLELLRQGLEIERNVYGEKSLTNTFRVIVRALLHSQLPLSHPTIIEDFYRISFKVFCNADKSEMGMCLYFLLFMF